MLNTIVILILGSLGVAQALFLSVYLFTLKSGRQTANVLLGLILLGLSIRIGKAVIFNYMYLEPWIRNLGISGFLLAGPALWLYGRTLFNKTQNLSQADYLHFVPFVLFAASCTFIPNDGSSWAFVFYTAVLAHLSYYLMLSWVLHRKSASTVQQNLRSWYLGILIGVSLIFLIYACIFFGLVPLYVLGATTFSFMIYMFSFIFLKKHHLALEKYAQSPVDISASKEVVQHLKTLFETEAPYLEPETSLQSIATRLDVQPRLLSQAINEVEHVNFSEFVNQYRVRRAKTLLQSPDHRHEKIATIAFDCGFGNITSFNTAFKSQLNMTPSQYRKHFAMTHSR